MMIITPTTLLPGVMPLLDHDEGDAGLVVWLQLDAGLPDGGQLVLQDVGELSLAHPVPVHDDPVGLVASRALVKHDQVLPHHLGQVLGTTLRHKSGPTTLSVSPE